MNEPVAETALPMQGLRIESLSAGFQSTTVLHDLTLELPRLGVIGLLGPSAVGKSTFLRTLSRWNEALPSFWRSGRLFLDDVDILTEISPEQCRRKICLLSQKARLYTASILENAIAEIHNGEPLTRDEKFALAHRALEPLGLWESLEPILGQPVLDLTIGRQRSLSIARLAAPQPDYLLIDEPLRDISDEDAEGICDILGRLSQTRGVLLVTHNLRNARRLCDHVLLMVDGYLIENLPAEEYFTQPHTGLGRIFLKSGNCPSLKGWLEESGEPDIWNTTRVPVVPPAQEKAPQQDRVAKSQPPSSPVAQARPGGFHWVVEGSLGGMQRPGLLQDLETDLDALVTLRCRVLVTLTEDPLTETVTPEIEEQLSNLDITLVHFPIVDMQVPTAESALELLIQIQLWIGEDRPTVVHCKAGLGRTGTILACFLVLRGASSVQAIDEVRSINPYYIQSDEQLEFIDRFGAFLEGRTS